MALTGLTNLQPLHIKTVGIGTFDNTVSIGGTLTYEDVTNVDAIGIITARSGINVSGGQLDVGSNIKLGNAGVITATSFVGSGSGLTGLNSDLVNDSSPQLGGALDVNGNNIQSGNAIYQIVLNQRHRFYSGGNQIIDINGNGVDFLHGNNTHADNVKSQFGDSNDLEIFHDGSINYIDSKGTQLRIETNVLRLRSDSGETFLEADANGALKIYHNNALKFDTVSTGIRVHGDEGGTAQLQLLADQGDDNADYWRLIAETNGILNIQDYGSGSWYNNIRCTGNTGGVILFHNNDAKLQTVSNGVQVDGILEGMSGDHLTLNTASAHSILFRTNGVLRISLDTNGHLLPYVNNTYDIGSSSNRFRNIYTNDLNLSNKGSTNSVDDTWGDYTIQEGESDLFLINNRNGKKYKFNLTEVS